MCVVCVWCVWCVCVWCVDVFVCGVCVCGVCVVCVCMCGVCVCVCVWVCVWCVCMFWVAVDCQVTRLQNKSVSAPRTAVQPVFTWLHFTLAPNMQYQIALQAIQSAFMPFVSSAAIVHIAAWRLVRGTAVTSYSTKSTKCLGGLSIRFDEILVAVSRVTSAGVWEALCIGCYWQTDIVCTCQQREGNKYRLWEFGKRHEAGKGLRTNSAVSADEVVWCKLQSGTFLSVMKYSRRSNGGPFAYDPHRGTSSLLLRPSGACGSTNVWTLRFCLTENTVHVRYKQNRRKLWWK